MKNATTPRRIYLHARTFTAHLSFRGVEWSSPHLRATRIDPSFPVTVDEDEDSEQTNAITVRQRKPHCKTVREVWHRR